ncbi:MAG: type II toxin-antitoxin system RelE/ParE family toxin [Pseudolabrys sp.]
MAGPSQGPLWSQDALADLADTWTYYAQVAGRAVADSVVREIYRTSDILADYPLAGRARDEVRPGLRCLVRQPHIVFYRVSSGVAEIVRVLDGRRDIDEAFGESPPNAT